MSSAETPARQHHPAPDPAPPDDHEFVRLYQELRGLAKSQLAGEPTGHSLQATALVHEAWLRLQSRGETTLNDPIRLYRAASLAMRRILIDHARSRHRVKRSPGQPPLSLDAVELATSGNADEILSVEEAICRLEQQDAALAEIVRLRFFVGLDVEEVAKVLGTSSRTVEREWSYAKAWLFRYLRPDTA